MRGAVRAFTLLLAVVKTAAQPEATAAVGTLPVNVTTPRGTVSGFHFSNGNDPTALFSGEADVFLGIPYAEAPTKERRFKLPVPKCSYGTETLVANAFKPHCPQRGLDAKAYSEDCLFLNVMSPNVSTPNAYPVMVFIHGGSFAEGGASTYGYQGAIRNFVSRGIVVVTIQYRIGLLGFFTTFTDEFPANRGLFDQALALRWVKEEISAFGGDPSRVTIVGHASGAAAVSAHTLSSISKGLFHQIIQQSGSVLAAIDVPENPNGDVHRSRAKALCNFDDQKWGAGDFKALADCLLKKTAADLTALDTNTVRESWAVMLDGAFLSDTPDALFNARPNLPAIIGDARDEYAYYMNHDQLTFTEDSVALFYRSVIAPSLLSDADIKKIASSLKKTFVPSLTTTGEKAKLQEQFSSVFTGLLYSAPTRRDLTGYISNQHDRLYIYTLGIEQQHCITFATPGWKSVPQSSEQCYLWRNGDLWTATPNLVSDTDKALSDTLSEAWASFIKNSSASPLAGWTASNDQYTYAYITSPTDRQMQSKWRIEADESFNKQLPTFFDNISPTCTTTPEWMAKLRVYGEKVNAQFASSVCKQYVETTTSEATTSDPVTESTSTTESTISTSEMTSEMTTSEITESISSTTDKIDESSSSSDITSLPPPTTTSAAVGSSLVISIGLLAFAKTI